MKIAKLAVSAASLALSAALFVLSLLDFRNNKMN